MPAWNAKKVGPKSEVIRQAKEDGKTVHFANLMMDLCHLKIAELAKKTLPGIQGASCAPGRHRRRRIQRSNHQMATEKLLDTVLIIYIKQTSNYRQLCHVAIHLQVTCEIQNQRQEVYCAYLDHARLFRFRNLSFSQQCRV